MQSMLGLQSHILQVFSRLAKLLEPIQMRPFISEIVQLLILPVLMVPVYIQCGFVETAKHGPKNFRRITLSLH